MAKNLVAPLSNESFAKNYLDHGIKSNSDVEQLFEKTIASLDKFTYGPYLWMISHLADHRLATAGGMTEELTGLSVEEFSCLRTGLRDFTAPEDAEAMFGFVYHSTEYRKQFPWDRRNEIFITYYFRLRINGTDRWTALKVLEESPEIQGVPQYLLSVLMDVSHIKRTGPPMMTIFDARTRQSKVFESGTHNELETSCPSISKRELEVLGLIAKGCSSKMIAVQLNISVKTVENHRRNILLKTNTSTSSEATTLALRSGLL